MAARLAEIVALPHTGQIAFVFVLMMSVHLFFVQTGDKESDTIQNNKRKGKLHHTYKQEKYTIEERRLVNQAQGFRNPNNMNSEIRQQ